MTDPTVRKLQQVGGGTFTVSIPKRWAVEHDLDAGTEVYLYPHADGSLVVRGAERNGSPLAATRVEIEGTAPARVERSLRAAYAVGFGTVTLVAAGTFTAEQHRAAEEVARALIGLEVTELGPETITVRSLLDPSAVSIEQLLNQLRSTIVSMLRTATEGADGAERLREPRAGARRLTRMVDRHFGRSLTSFEEIDHLGLGRDRLDEYRRVACALDRLADEAVRIAERTGATDGPDDLDAIGDDVGTLVDEATAAVLAGGPVDAAHEALDRHEEVRESLSDAEGRIEDVARLRTLDALRRMAETGARIAEIALCATLRAGTP